MTHQGRHFLQIPGPTNVPDRVLRAMAQATIDHRGPQFARLGREVLEGRRQEEIFLVVLADGEQAVLSNGERHLLLLEAREGTTQTRTARLNRGLSGAACR